MISKTPKLKYVGFSIFIKITKPDKVVLRRRSPLKIRILKYFQRNFKQGDRVYFKITYKKGIHNDGVYYDETEFMKAYEAFTEDSFIKEVINDY